MQSEIYLCTSTTSKLSWVKKQLGNVIHILFWWQLMRILLSWICDMPLVNSIMLTIHMLIHIAIKWINKVKESTYHWSCPHHDQQKEYATFILGESGGHNCLLDELMSYLIPNVTPHKHYYQRKSYQYHFKVFGIIAYMHV